MEKEKSGLKSSFSISFVVLLGKILGFIKQAVIAWAFGANTTTDIFFAANGFTYMFAQIMGQSVSPTVLTGYVELDEKGKKKQATDLIRQSFFFFGLVGLCLIVVIILFSPLICELFGVNYTMEQKKEFRFFLIALCPEVLFTSLSGVAQGYLDGHKRFLPGKLCSLFFSLSIIISVIALRKVIGVQSYMYGLILGFAVHTVYMLALTVTKTGMSFGNPFKNNEFRQLIKRFGPLVVGNSIVDLGLLIDRIIASSLVAGSVSALYYGQVISSDIVNAVIITSIGTVLLTDLTKKVYSHIDKIEISNQLQRTICTMTLITGFISSLYFVEGYDLVKLFFERGSFEAYNTVIVSSIASFYGIGFIFMANREVVVKAHYAFQDTKTPMINSIIGVVVNLIGSILLSKIMGVSGVAFATSLSMMVVSALSMLTIKKHIGRFPMNRKSMLDVIKILLGNAIVIGVGTLLRNMTTDWHLLIRMVVVSAIMGIVYLITIILLKEMIITTAIIPAIKKRFTDRRK